MNADTPATEPVQLASRAERRRQARHAPEVEVVEAAAEETTGDKTEEPPTIGDTILFYGKTVADLQRVHKVPHAQGIRLVEVILQYDINRRHLAVQEAEAMRGMVPFGAVPRTPEEVDALQANAPDVPDQEG